MPSNIKAEQIALSFASGVTVGGMSLDDDDLCPARTSRSSSSSMGRAMFHLLYLLIS